MTDEKKPTGKPPAFQLYASDFYMDTQEFSVCEVGAYTRLLMAQWVNNDLPLEIDRLASMAGMQIVDFEPVWERIKFKFYHSKKRVFNVRLDKTKKALIANRANKSKAGSIGAEIRWSAEMGAKDKLLAIEAMIKETVGDPTMEVTGKYILDNIQKIYKDVDYKWKDGDLIKFKEAWEGWKLYKKTAHNEKYKDPISETKAIGIIYKQTGGNVNWAVDMIDLSISRSWKGVTSDWKLDSMHNPKPNKNDTSSYNDQR